MNNLQRTLENVANARRRELLPYIFNQTECRVQRGPFSGMTIVPKTSWGDGDSAAKLLGVYEDELHPAVEDAIKRNPDLILNVGCAEGYYGIGLAARLPESHVIAVDINSSYPSQMSKVPLPIGKARHINLHTMYKGQHILEGIY